MKLLRRLRLHYAIRQLAGTRLLKAFAHQRPEAFFVQVGANDGKMMDPIQRQVRNSRWQGLALEPVPALYEALCLNYAALADRIRPVNLAISVQSGAMPFYHLANRPGLLELPDWALGLGTFNKAVLLKHVDRIQDLGDYLNTIDVPGKTWRDFCSEYVSRPIDLLVVDTEGYDYEILRQLDFRQQRPVLIIYEHHHFSPATRRDCLSMLGAAGYRMFEEGLDTWALQFEAGDPQDAPLREKWPRWIESSRYAQAVTA